MASSSSSSSTDPAEALNTPEEDPEDSSEDSEQEEYGDTLLANLLEQLYADFRRAPLNQKAGAHANLLRVLEEYLRKEHEIYALPLVDQTEKKWVSLPMDRFVERIGRSPPVVVSGSYQYWDHVYYPTGKICIRFH